MQVSAASADVMLRPATQRLCCCVAALQAPLVAVVRLWTCMCWWQSCRSSSARPRQRQQSRIRPTSRWQLTWLCWSANRRTRWVCAGGAAVGSRKEVCNALFVQGRLVDGSIPQYRTCNAPEPCSVACWHTAVLDCVQAKHLTGATFLRARLCCPALCAGQASDVSVVLQLFCIVCRPNT